MSVCKDDFNILKVIGRGSFGKVFLISKKDNPNKLYALKVLGKNFINKNNLMTKT